MILLQVAVNATFILAIGSLLVASARPLNAAAKHALCVITLALPVLLPLLAALPPHARPALVDITVEHAAVPVSVDFCAFWLTGLWAFGCLVILVRFAGGTLYLRRLTRRASAPVAGLAPGHVSVVYADVTTPMMWGWLRSVILLPKCFTEWSVAARQATVIHELAHVERRDTWTALIVTAAQAIYWFHPLVWWLSKKLVEQREFAADDRVLLSGTDASSYAAALLQLARLNQKRTAISCAMSGGSLRSRIAYVLRPRRQEKRTLARVCMIGGVALLLGFVCLTPATAHFSDENYAIGGDVSAPHLVFKREPQYTKKSRQEKTQGTVLLSAVIDRVGKPRAVHVERSLTPDLDRQAVRAVSAWKFKPAMKDGKAVSVRVKIEVNFRLL